MVEVQARLARANLNPTIYATWRETDDRKSGNVSALFDAGLKHSGNSKIDLPMELQNFGF